MGPQPPSELVIEHLDSYGLDRETAGLVAELAVTSGRLRGLLAAYRTSLAATQAWKRPELRRALAYFDTPRSNWSARGLISHLAALDRTELFRAALSAAAESFPRARRAGLERLRVEMSLLRAEMSLRVRRISVRLAQPLQERIERAGRISAAVQTAIGELSQPSLPGGTSLVDASAAVADLVLLEVLLASETKSSDLLHLIRGAGPELAERHDLRLLLVAFYAMPPERRIEVELVGSDNLGAFFSQFEGWVGRCEESVVDVEGDAETEALLVCLLQMLGELVEHVESREPADSILGPLFRAEREAGQRRALALSDHTTENQNAIYLAVFETALRRSALAGGGRLSDNQRIIPISRSSCCGCFEAIWKRTVSSPQNRCGRRQGSPASWRAPGRENNPRRTSASRRFDQRSNRRSSAIPTPVAI